MATAEENLARFQEIADRGLQDSLTGDIRRRYRESVRRGLVSQPRREIPDDELTDFNKDIGPFQAAGIAAGRGIATIGRAVGIGEPEDPLTTARFERLQEMNPISTFLGEIGGETAPFLPLGLAAGAIRATVPRVAAAVGLGAAEGVAITRGQGRNISEQFKGAGIGGTIAGTVELALPRILRLGSKVIRRFLNKVPEGAVIDAAGNPSPEFQKALDQGNMTFQDVVDEVNQEFLDESLDPSQVSRKIFLEGQGLNPSQAQITRDASDFQLQQEAAKKSSRQRTQLEGQEAFLTSRFSDVATETGGAVPAPTNTVFDAVTAKATVLDNEIGRLYKVARETAPGEKNVKFDSLTRRLMELAPSNRRAGGNIEAIVGDLQKKGVLDQDLKLVGKIDVETAEDVRKLMNELVDKQNPFGNMLLRDLKDKLDDDVFRAAGDDVFNEARSAKRNFEQELNRAKVSKFDNRKDNLVRDVLENKIGGDEFTDKVVFGKKWRATDLQQLKDYLSTDAAGKQAFNDLRADVVDTIKERSFIGPEDAAGNKALSRDKLERTLKTIGPDRMKVLFTPDERKFFDNMLQVAKLREPVRGTALGQGPSAQAIIARLEERAKKVPVVGSIVDVIDIDAAGRASIKGKPTKTAKRIGPSSVRALISAPTVAGAVTETDDNQ